jgi:predicted secreted protein
MPTHILTELEEQAKEMEKQQIIDAFNVGFKDRGLSFLQGEQYYNKTFKNK